MTGTIRIFKLIERNTTGRRGSLPNENPTKPIRIYNTTNVIKPIGISFGISPEIPATIPARKNKVIKRLFLMLTEKKQEYYFCHENTPENTKTCNEKGV